MSWRGETKGGGKDEVRGWKEDEWEARGKTK